MFKIFQYNFFPLHWCQGWKQSKPVHFAFKSNRVTHLYKSFLLTDIGLKMFLRTMAPRVGSGLTTSPRQNWKLPRWRAPDNFSLIASSVHLFSSVSRPWRYSRVLKMVNYPRAFVAEKEFDTVFNILWVGLVWKIAVRWIRVQNENHLADLFGV